MSLIRADIFAIYSFDSTASSMGADELFIGEDIPHIVMPLPTEIGKTCGLAIKIWPGDIEKTRELLNKNLIEYKLYSGIKSNKKASYKLEE